MFVNNRQYTHLRWGLSRKGLKFGDKMAVELFIEDCIHPKNPLYCSQAPDRSRRIFCRIGNFVPYTTKASGRMRTRAKTKYVASNRARRENVPWHILFHT